MLKPDAPPVAHLAEEVGVSQTTLFRWRREAVNLQPHKEISTDSEGQSRRAMKRRPQDRTPEEKLRLVQEASALGDEELGAFLRREGVHEADLLKWREAMLGGLSQARSILQKGSNFNAQDRRRIKSLERELRRKEKALAESAALLLLQKKVRRLWGDEDETTHQS